MKIDINNIELIDKYLDKRLTRDEIETVENKLKADLDFQDLFKEQFALIQGVKRAGLKQEIQIAKQSYYKFKWLKIFGISLSFIVVLLIVWMIFFNTPQIETFKPIIESNTVVVSNTDSVEKIEQKYISNITDSVVAGIEKSTTKKTQITSDELKGETKRVKVEESLKKLELISLPLDSTSVKKKQKVVTVKTEKDFYETPKVGTTHNNLETSFINSLIGTYEMRLEAINALIIDKLTLNPNGTFEFYEYDNHEKGIPRERNKYSKGTWKVDKNIIIFTTSKSDFDEKYTLNFNNTKARFITKSPRDTSGRDIKTSIQFYDSDIFWITGRTLFKVE